MLSIEDLDIMKQMEDYNLTFQKVTAFSECRYTLRKNIEGHLKYMMCDSKRIAFQRHAFVIEARHKMPVDVMEFDYVYVGLKIFKLE